MYFAICIESSHKRGLGHLFRTINFVNYLKNRDVNFIVLINEDSKSNNILKEYNIPFEIVVLQDYNSDWESQIINKYNIDIWINDRLDTDISHAKNVKKNDIKLISYDDKGSGAELVDINVSALIFKNIEKIKGKKVLTGTDYLVLNNEIEQYRKIRRKINKILVTLGGSDTYGVTIKVVKILKEKDIPATIITGPSFAHKEELEVLIDNRFTVKSYVPSLIEEFSNYDLAITGGGVTPFEANASGLPCIIVANEPHEVEIAEFLDTFGSSIFAGYHEKIDDNCFTLDLDIEKLSTIGLKMKLSAIENIFEEIIRI